MEPVYVVLAVALVAIVLLLQRASHHSGRSRAARSRRVGDGMVYAESSASNDCDAGDGGSCDGGGGDGGGGGD